MARNFERNTDANVMWWKWKVARSNFELNVKLQEKAILIFTKLKACDRISANDRFGSLAGRSKS